MLNILFIGDISGRIGRQAVAKILPKLKKKQGIDFVIANAENAAHGSGITENILKELMEAGIDYFTSGDHAFKRTKQLEVYTRLPTIRPANYPPGCPGKGYDIIDINGKKLLLINLIGRVFMKKDYDCPFRKIDEILASELLSDKKLSAIMVDIHAEATSEKISLAHYMEGRVSAVLGTHTHVMTADGQIKKGGTAYITDVGMTGYADGSIGVDMENVIKTYKTQIKTQFVYPEKGRAIFNAVKVKINTKNRQAKSIKPIVEFINIK